MVLAATTQGNQSDDAAVGTKSLVDVVQTVMLGRFVYISL